MADATVVGSTRVSLIPDMSQFGDRLRIQLPSAIREPAKLAGDLAGDTIRNAISKKLAKPIGVKVKATLDDQGAKAALQRLTQARTVKLVAELDDKAAVAGLARLTADRKVKVVAEVDDTAAKTKLGALAGQHTVDILPKIQQAAYRQAEQQLARLVKDRVVNIRATVDTRVAANEIRNLIQRRTVRVGADVDTRVAAADLANLTQRRTVRINADVDTAAAAARLATLTRDRRVNVRVNSVGLGALTAGLTNLGGSGGGGAGGIGALSSRIFSLAGAAASALPAIASLASTIAQMAPLAATAAPAMALLGTAFAAIKVGTSGIGDAIKAAFQPAAGDATKAATAVRQVETAHRQLATAQRSVADAERTLTEAQRTARQAQNDLNAARRQATRDLEDMNAQLKQGRLDQKQAALDVEQAELDLAKVRADPTATQLQIEQADLALQRARANAEEQSRQQKRLQADTAAANKAGVEGSDVVVQAKEKIRQADLQVQQQERALADAHRAVADAARAVADAQQQAATQTSKLDTAIAKLSPNAKAFVGQLQAMAPAWRDMRLDVQDRLFAGIGTRLGVVGAQILPTVRSGLTGTAGELNIMGKNALTAVSNLEKTGTLKKIFDGVKTSLGNVSRIPGQMVTGFGQLTVAAQPAFDRLTAGAAGVVDKVMGKLAKGVQSGHLTDAINTALDIAMQFGKVLGDIGAIFGSIFKAASDAGGNAFGAIGAAIAEIRRVVQMPEVQAALRSVFKALNTIAQLLAGTLGAVIQAALPLLAALAPVVQQLAQQFAPVLVQLAQTLGAALMPIITALLPVVQNIGSVIVGLVQAVLPLLQPIAQVLASVIQAIAPFIQTLLGALVPFVAVLAKALVPIVLALVPAVHLVGQFLAAMAPLFPQLLGALTPLLPPISQLTVSLLTLALQVITPLMPLITGLARLLTFVLGGAIKILVPIISTVIGWVTTFMNAVTVAVKWIVDKFKWLFDVLLGHSIIPDIVRGSIKWFTDMWKGLIKIVTWIHDGIISLFRGLKDGAVKIWNGFWGLVKSIASIVWKQVQVGLSEWGDAIKTTFRTIRDGVGKIWNGIKDLVKAPIKFWIDVVYNKGIVPVWNNTAAKIPGVPDLKTMSMPKGFARGGVLPGWSTWRDGDDQLVPMRRGEGVYVSEVMRDPYERARLYALNQAAMRGQHPAAARQQMGFSGGGIFGSIGSGIASVGSSIADGVGSVLKKGANAVRGGLADIAESAFKPVKNGITKALGNNKNSWPGMIAGAPISFIDKAIDWIRGKDTPASSGQWIKPVNVPYGTKFGVKGSMWSSGRHTGLDFPAKTGTKVVAVDNGTVKSAQSNGPYGNHVMINHGGGLSSLYAHMSAIAAKVGAGIKQGGPVGAVGATGNVTGPHLHLEARINGKSVDPMPYLTGGGGGDGGSGVQRWRGIVTQALGQVHQSLSLADTTLRRMNQESGGNPTAVNRTDSNWKAGHPSVGLMQVIEGTFRAYAGKYKNTGPFMYGVSTNPMANVYAAMRYALSRYGSLSSAFNRPGGYATGGLVGGIRIGRGLPRGYATGGVIKVGGKRIDIGPLASAVGGDFLKQLTGTAAQISAAMDKVATAVKNAFKGVKTTLDNKLLAQISASNKQLQALSKQRDAIASKITAANQLASDSTNQANTFAQMTSLPNGGNTFDAGGILSGLNVRLGQIKAFGANLKTLAARGLSKTLLQQIIAAGPDQGAAYAKALVDATPKQLKDINLAQSQIAAASTAYGKDAADAMYDAGSQSGKGYLAGLAAQEKAIDNAMSSLAKKIQAAIKKALKIKSPSRVFAELGQFTVQGFAQGMREATPQAATAAARMAALVHRTAAATTARVENSTTTAYGDRVLNYNATVREQASRASILAALALEDTLHRPVVVGG
ncbi:peptidoglycan DD-metalloendopeptidase family protein [Streptomyces sp. NBC_01483]|uniref:peptidoglycan DD-metalloendopeptidase family protein n=1 Tax=Streptomyces sp. NBC_01483 TaxID=2903883 RepID=UPI002E362259|nr:peptidoglycan DD-metalloendopeptidase family protein [Streptomyces sp. NBC_01483]